MAALCRLFTNQSLQSLRYTRLIIRRSWSSKADENDEEVFSDKPIPYSTSKAASWTAEHSFHGPPKENVAPWYQPLVISFSLLAFLLYFGVLREENDIDLNLGTSLYDRLESLEEEEREKRQ